MHRNYNFDKLLELSDGGSAISADGASKVSGSAAELEVGAARFEAVMVIDISACDDGNADETYDLQIRGAAATGMGSPAQITSVTVTRGTTGRIELPFVNVKQGTTYPFIDLYVDVAGTSPSITFTAFAERVNGWGC